MVSVSLHLKPRVAQGGSDNPQDTCGDTPVVPALGTAGRDPRPHGKAAGLRLIGRSGVASKVGDFAMKAEDLAGWIIQEHHKVSELAARLEDFVDCVPKANQAKWIQGVREAFEHFRAHLTKHMALEEQDGYMVPVVERRPALSTDVERLAHEHQEFARLMQVIQQGLGELEPTDQLLIRDCCHRIQDFLAYVEHHKNEENLMVLTVFNIDIGGHH